MKTHIFEILNEYPHEVMLYNTCLCDSSKCFISTATTTFTSTNWAINTNMTKNMGAIPEETQQFRTQSAWSSHSSRSVSFMMPFQLSPVATRNKVKKAMPKLLKCACSPRPWHGCSSLHSVKYTELIKVEDFKGSQPWRNQKKTWERTLKLFFLIKESDSKTY